jgi:hypothetical protein
MGSREVININRSLVTVASARDYYTTLKINVAHIFEWGKKSR